MQPKNFKEKTLKGCEQLGLALAFTLNQIDCARRVTGNEFSDCKQTVWHLTQTEILQSLNNLLIYVSYFTLLTATTTHLLFVIVAFSYNYLILLYMFPVCRMHLKLKRTEFTCNEICHK